MTKLFTELSAETFTDQIFDEKGFNNEVLTKDLKEINQKITNLQNDIKTNKNQANYQIMKRQLVDLQKKKKETEIKLEQFESKELARAIVSYQKKNNSKLPVQNADSQLMHQSHSSFFLKYSNSPEIIDALELISDALSGDYIPKENETLIKEYQILEKEFLNNPISLDGFFD